MRTVIFFLGILFWAALRAYWGLTLDISEVVDMIIAILVGCMILDIFDSASKWKK